MAENSNTNTNSNPTPIIVSGGGGGWTKVLPWLGAAVAIWWGKKQFDEWMAQRNKDASDSELDTDDGRIALQLKNVFESTPVNDALYRQVMLQVNTTNSDNVRKLYKKMTGRNLQDDEADHISAKVQTTVAKQQVINSTTAGLIQIVNDQIKFLVGPGSLVRTPVGSKTNVSVYLTPENIALNKPAIVVKPSETQYVVNAVKEVPYESIQLVEGWEKYFRPYVKTRKVYAAVQLKIPNKDTGKDAKGNWKNYLYPWIDARDMRVGSGTANILKGLGTIDLLY